MRILNADLIYFYNALIIQTLVSANVCRQTLMRCEIGYQELLSVIKSMNCCCDFASLIFFLILEKASDKIIKN